MKLSDAVRETMVGIKLAAALGTVLGFGGLVSMVLVFARRLVWLDVCFFSRALTSVTS